MDDTKISEPTLKEKTAKGLFWGGISNLVQQIIGAAFNIFIARILAPDDYGIIGMLAIFSAIASTLMDSGFTTALINKKTIKHEDYNAVFWFSAILGVTLYTILFCAAPLIAKFYDQPVLTNLSRLVFLGFLINSMALAHNALLLKKLMVKERAKIDITAVTTSGAVGLVLALSGFAYWGLAIQALLMAAISVILRWRFAPWKPTFGRIDFSPLRTMIGFGVKLLVTSIVVQIYANALSVIFGKYYDEEQVGYFTQANKWMQLCCMVISGMIASVAQPIFVEINEDKKRHLHVFRKMVRFGAFISFPVMLGLAFVSREFILITVGEKWIESVPFLQLLCIYGGFYYLVNLYLSLLYSYGRSNIVMWYNIAISCAILISSLALVGHDILHIIIVYTSILIASIIGWHCLAHQFIGMRTIYLLKDMAPYLLITLSCFLIAWLCTLAIQNIYLLFALKIGIVGGLYFMISRYSGSVIFKESMRFINPHNDKK